MLNGFKTSIPWIIGAISLFVMFGWIIDSHLIVQISSNNPSMKFSTAFLFLLSAFQLRSINELIVYKNILRTKLYLTLSIISACLILFSALILVAPALFSNFLNAIHHETYDPWTRIPHIPSIATLICFFLISCAQIKIILFPHRTECVLLYLGAAITATGVVAVIGNIFDIPMMFYANLSGGGMAVHTATLFVLIGLYFFGIYKEVKSL